MIVGESSALKLRMDRSTGRVDPFRVKLNIVCAHSSYGERRWVARMSLGGFRWPFAQKVRRIYVRHVGDAFKFV